MLQPKPMMSLSRLMDLVDGDIDMAREIAELFAQSTQTSREMMRGALEQHKIDMWLVGLHDLKGASGNLGFSSLFELCKQAHDQVKNHAESPEDWHDMLMEHLDGVLAYLQEQIA